MWRTKINEEEGEKRRSGGLEEEKEGIRGNGFTFYMIDPLRKVKEGYFMSNRGQQHP